MSNTIADQLRRIESDITKLTAQEDSIRGQMRALRAEHAGIIQSFLASTTTPIPKQAAEAATQVAQVKDPLDRHTLAVEKASGLVRKILSAHPNGLSIDGILAGVGIIAPTASHRYDLESLLTTLNKAGQVRTVSRDGVHFKYFLEGQAPVVATPEPVKLTTLPALESRMGRIMGRVSEFYRSGRRLITTSELFPEDISSSMALIRHMVTHTMVNLGVLSHTATAHTYNILRDPCDTKTGTPASPTATALVRTAQELDDLYVQAVSKVYRANGPAIRAEDFEKLDPEGCRNFPLQVMAVISRLLRTGVLVPLGGSHYKAVCDPLAPAVPAVPSVAAPSPVPPSPVRSTRFHPSGHGDYPPGVHVLTRELLDHMREEAAQTYRSTTYTIDDVVSWLGSRGVSSANIRTRASHILASLVGFGCLNRTGSGKYTLRDYRGYKIPQTTQEK